MTAPTNLYITPAYWNPTQADKDKAQLWKDVGWAYDCAHSGDFSETVPVLLDWAVHNETLVNWEAKLIMTFKGQLFLESYLMLPDELKMPEFPDWVYDVYLPGALTLWKENNNQGAWGLLGRTLANIVLGYDQQVCIDRYYQIISKATDNTGCLYIETLRTNSGMWYSYFFLAPLLRVAQLLPVEQYMLTPALEWLWQYVQHPETWPYKLAPVWTPKGMWQRLVHPCASQVELPRKDDWPANLYWVAGKMFNRPDWQYWGNPPRYWTNIFRFGD